MKTLTAIAVVLGVFALSASHSDVDAHGKKYGKRHSHYTKGVKPQVRGYVARGYAYGYEYERQPYQSLYAGRNPYLDQSTWERVNSDPRSNTLGASGL